MSGLSIYTYLLRVSSYAPTPLDVRTWITGVAIDVTLRKTRGTPSLEALLSSGCDAAFACVSITPRDFRLLPNAL